MDLDFDPFDDILSGPDGGNARAGAKFRPKAKPHSRKETRATVSSNLTHAVKDPPSITTTVDQDCITSLTKIPEVMSCTTTIANPLPNLPPSHEMVNNNGVLYPSFPLPDGDKSSAPVDTSSQHPMDKEYMDSEGSLQSESFALDAHGDLQSGREYMDSGSALQSESIVLNTHGDLQSGVSKSGTETADIYFDFDDIIGDSTTSYVSAVRKFQPRVKVNAESKSNASKTEYLEGEPGRSSLSNIGGSTLRPCSFVPTDTSPEHVPQETVNDSETYYQDLLINAAETEREEQEFPGLQSLHDISQTTTLGNAERSPPSVDYFGDDQHTAPADQDFVNFSTEYIPHVTLTDGTLEFPMAEETTQHADASGANPSITQEVVDSQNVPPRKQRVRSKKRKSSTALENEKVHLSNGEPSPETRDEDGDDEYRVDNTTHGKTAQNDKPAVQKKKGGRKRKNASEEPETLIKEPEPPKKKFPHSTRRNRRQVNKALLETPEDEIDRRNLPLKDLILLGELREERLKKDAITAKKSAPNQSINNLYPEDGPYDPDDPFASMQDMNPDGATTPPKLNYHSFMKKRPRKRWSKQDTELFYEAIRQFGTDFTMIEQLFPDLDDDPIRRRQIVKLKYKNEERKQPMRLNDALTNRSKNHSHFELIIEKLRQAEQNSDEEMESVGVSAEAEDNIPETNGEAEIEENTEVGNEFETAKIGSPVKSVHETEDDTYKWSPADSDYDDYNPY